jgi:uncharacterized protein
MPDGGLTTKTDVADFARGTDFLSASGGGAPTEALELLNDDVDRGVALGWTDLQSLPDDALVVSTFFHGSIAPDSFDTADIERECGVSRIVKRPLVQAVQELEQHLGRTVDAIISVEIGGVNTGCTVDAAANLGKLLVDADYAGRAIPEAQCVTPHMTGEDMVPLVAVDYYGDVTIIKQQRNNTMSERLGKCIAMASFGLVGCAAVPLSGAVVKRIAIPGSLTRSLAVGRAIREAREAGQDPVAASAKAIGSGVVLFRGTVAERTWENRAGYMWGEHEIEGRDGFDGRLKVWFKNENHVSWLDGAPYAASPDVLEFVDDETGEPRVNTDLAVGDRIAVIGVKRCDQFDNDAGIAAMGPRHWGFDLDFRPIEQLVTLEA